MTYVHTSFLMYIIIDYNGTCYNGQLRIGHYSMKNTCCNKQVQRVATPGTIFTVPLHVSLLSHAFKVLPVYMYYTSHHKGLLLQYVPLTCYKHELLTLLVCTITIYTYYLAEGWECIGNIWDVVYTCWRSLLSSATASGRFCLWTWLMSRLSSQVMSW